MPEFKINNITQFCDTLTTAKLTGAVTDAALAALTFAECENDLVQVGGSAIYSLTLTAAEMTADHVWVVGRLASDASVGFDIYIDVKSSAGAQTSGPGAIEVPLTIDDGTNPVDGAEVWITTDAAGTNQVAGVLHTDAFGKVTFWLDAGTYYVFAKKAGIDFANATPLTVAS